MTEINFTDVLSVHMNDKADNIVMAAARGNDGKSEMLWKKDHRDGDLLCEDMVNNTFGLTSSGTRDIRRWDDPIDSRDATWVTLHLNGDCGYKYPRINLGDASKGLMYALIWYYRTTDDPDSIESFFSSHSDLAWENGFHSGDIISDPYPTVDGKETGWRWKSPSFCTEYKDFPLRDDPDVIEYWLTLRIGPWTQMNMYYRHCDATLEFSDSKPTGVYHLNRFLNYDLQEDRDLFDGEPVIPEEGWS